MIRKALLGGLTLLALSLPAKATLTFPTSGVWSEPRIYSGTSLATEPLNINETYKFKTKLSNYSDQSESDYLTAQITGPQNFTLDYGLVTINPNDDSIRTRTLSDGFSIPGDYNITMNLDHGENISKDFKVIPEPASLVFLGLGAALLAKGKRR